MTERPQRPPYTSLVVLAAILLAAFVWSHAPSRPAGAPAKEAKSRIFERFGTLADIEFAASGGQTVRLSGFKGKPVVLNLWATWCAPCVEEMPSLDRLQRDFPGVEVVAVSLDREGEDKVRAFMTENGLTHLKIYTDPSMKSLAKLGVPGLPATILVAPDGTETGGINGAYDWDSPEARAAVAGILPQAADGASPKPPLSVEHPPPASRSNGITEASFGQ